MAASKVRSLTGVLLGLICLSFLEYRILSLIHRGEQQSGIDIAEGILSGHPTWKILQSRLLGPVVVSLVSHVSHLSFASCYLAFCGVAVLAANAACYFLFFSEVRSRAHTWIFVVGYATLFLVFQDSQYLYIWDYIDLTTILVFGWMVAKDKFPIWGIAVLCFVELFNRESAQFIALWILIDSVTYDHKGSPGNKLRIDLRRAGIGLLLVVLCIGWTHYIRDRLTIAETSPFPEGVRSVAGQMWMFPHIWFYLKTGSPHAIATLAILLATLLFLYYRAIDRLDDRSVKVLILAAIMIAANLCFALITELRVWFALLSIAYCFSFVRRPDSDAQLE